MIFRYAAAGAGALALVAMAGWYVTRGNLNEVRADRDQYKVAYEGLQNTLKVERANAESARQIEQTYQEALTDAQLEINNLRAAVESGSTKLYVRAACPKLPGTPQAKPGNDAAAATLSRESEQAYLDLRGQHEQVIAQVKALQSFARLCAGLE